MKESKHHRVVIEKPTMPLKDVDAEWKERGRWGQCMAMAGGRSIVFCVRPKGHKGSHRGYRKQWREEE